MRSLRLGESARDARRTLSAGWRLIGRNIAASLELGSMLSLLPALLTALLVVLSMAPLLDLWAAWAEGLFAGASGGTTLYAMLAVTRQRTALLSLPVTLLNLAGSLLLKPLLLSALALLYNGRVAALGVHPSVAALRMVWRNAKNLVLVALTCMLAEWFVQILPSMVSGLLSAVAGLLSFIPVLGTVAVWLAAILSEIIPLLTDVALTVVFSYVWIAASCEGVSGFGALVRSWQITRNAMRETVAALFGLALLRWAAVIVLGALWLFAGRPAGVPLTALIYAVYAIGAVFTVMLGAVTSALYLRRPVSRGPSYGQFHTGGPDIGRMKRANVDDE